ncbi:MAG: F-box protein [Legionella longbeachae]|nr:F-box protein [Legionella longbeachae]
MFDKLPYELKLYITQFLLPEDLSNLALVNSNLNKISRTPQLFFNHLRLLKVGFGEQKNRFYQHWPPDIFAKIYHNLKNKRNANKLYDFHRIFTTLDPWRFGTFYFPVNKLLQPMIQDPFLIIMESGDVKFLIESLRNPARYGIPFNTDTLVANFRHRLLTTSMKSNNPELFSEMYALCGSSFSSDDLENKSSSFLGTSATAHPLIFEKTITELKKQKLMSKAFKYFNHFDEMMREYDLETFKLKINSLYGEQGLPKRALLESHLTIKNLNNAKNPSDMFHYFVEIYEKKLHDRYFVSKLNLDVIGKIARFGMVYCGKGRDCKAFHKWIGLIDKMIDKVNRVDLCIELNLFSIGKKLLIGVIESKNEKLFVDLLELMHKRANEEYKKIWDRTFTFGFTLKRIFQDDVLIEFLIAAIESENMAILNSLLDWIEGYKLIKNKDALYPLLKVVLLCHDNLEPIERVFDIFDRFEISLTEILEASEPSFLNNLQLAIGAQNPALLNRVFEKMGGFEEIPETLLKISNCQLLQRAISSENIEIMNLVMSLYQSKGLFDVMKQMQEVNLFFILMRSNTPVSLKWFMKEVVNHDEQLLWQYMQFLNEENWREILSYEHNLENLAYFLSIFRDNGSLHHPIKSLYETNKHQLLLVIYLCGYSENLRYHSLGKEICQMTIVTEQGEVKCLDALNDLLNDEFIQALNKWSQSLYAIELSQYLKNAQSSQLNPISCMRV